MPTSIDQVIHEALTLSEHERAEVAHVLLRSLGNDEAEPDQVEAAWETKIARRVERINQGIAAGRPAEDVFRDLRARYQ